MNERYIKDSPHGNFRDSLIREYLGKTVEIHIDRPIGFIHKKEKYSLHYSINYGYIPNVLGGDGEELDVYLLGVDVPVEKASCKIIAAVRRYNDCEDKLVGCPEALSYTKEEIMKSIEFQEKYYDSEIICSTKEI